VLWVCLDCTTRYAESLVGCPHCGSERRAEAHQVDDDQPSGGPVGLTVGGDTE
jgi:rRNA maturation endonuclease Nob1